MSNDVHGDRMTLKVKQKALLVAALAIVCCVAFAVLLIRGPSAGLYLSQTPLLVMLVIAAMIFGGITRALFKQVKREEAGEPAPKVDFSHTYRLTGILAVLLVVGAAARQFFIPDGFGKYGHYRPEAVEKARAQPIRHRGEDSCKKCHPKNYDLHAKGMHKPVECEVCHGPSDRHAVAGDTRLIKRQQVRCLVCHQELPARPETFPQIDVSTHFLNKGMGKGGVACYKCHNPHQPLFIDQSAATARVNHPVSHQCRDCHAHMPSGTAKPKQHPVVFDCNYCHADKAKAVAARPHKHLGCRTCHKFSRAAKYYGYIIRSMVKNRDRRFCLLCHQKMKGRTGSKPPTIVWETHLKEMAGDLKASCISCHQDKIHPVKKPAVQAAPPAAMEAPPAAVEAPPAAMDAPDPRVAPRPGARVAPMSTMAPMSMAPAAGMVTPRVRPRPRRRPPRMPSSHRGSASHKTCNRACHSGLLPASHSGRSGASCRACHR